MSPCSDYSTWFSNFTGYSPRDWQLALGTNASFGDRLLRVPTGFGKTSGTIAAWAYHRIVRQDQAWPRRLIFCLPMRVLVEQTEAEVRQWFRRVDLLWEGTSNPGGRVGVHVLMGGVETQDWHLYPEECAVLIGTQDMLLSRALNRGYGSARARWPMEFGLLNQDCLWVLDEVQLMDVGLATSVQLQAFRQERVSLRPCASFWMSATLQPSWLRTCVDFAPHVDGLPVTGIQPNERGGELWSVEKPCRMASLPGVEDKERRRWAELVVDAHSKTARGITLAVVNTVEGAIMLFESISRLLKEREQSADIRLVHSRFRGKEKAGWRKDFLSRDACHVGANRIIVATQVVEAGVDVSADALITELAPWASLVQRFGRCARYGGRGEVVVVSRFHTEESALQIEAKGPAERARKQVADDEKACPPYEPGVLLAARAALLGVPDVGPAALEAFEERASLEQIAALYPYEPPHVLVKREMDDLFDTGPDLTGADLDISRFIRSGEERDVSVCFWSGSDTEAPQPDVQPLREARCPVSFLVARKWLCEADTEGGRLKEGCRAWTWDYLDGKWRSLRARDIYPGQTLLVDTNWGGYDATIGFHGRRPDKKTLPIDTQGTFQEADARLSADLAQDREDLSVSPYKTIATHGRESAQHARAVASALDLPVPLPDLLDLAARLHDLGKAHPVFAAAIRDKGVYAGRVDLAKAPDAAWYRGKGFFCHDAGSGPRPGFRHELASTLALFELLFLAQPDHPALLGPHRSLLSALGMPEPPPPALRADGIVAELCLLDAPSFNLVAWLVCCHHGKVRATWQGSPDDQLYVDEDQRGQPLRGVREGDVLPSVQVADNTGGNLNTLPPVPMHLEPASLGLSARYGESWIDRVHGLREHFGTFALAYLETLLRVGDVRASRLETGDPLLAAARPGGQP